MTIMRLASKSIESGQLGRVGTGWDYKTARVLLP
jgi:hypothetical protein